MDYDSEFWTSDHRYEDLAREYERHIERVHPAFVTSQRMCVCLNYTSRCGWAATSVIYHEYRGPKLT